MFNDAFLQSVMSQGLDIGLKVVGAILVWIIGRWLINMAVGLLSRGLNRQQFDKTLTNYIMGTVKGLLTVVLIISILGMFGVQTTTFAALFAAVGIAIGSAWAGLLSNFAAGVFMVILQPFKVGDFITAGGVTGTVVEIGPFGTTIDTPDNIRTIVGNNKIMSDNIQNFHANPYRRVDLTAQLNHGAPVAETIAELKTRLAQIPNVLKDPAPVVEILELTLNGPKLAVRPFCSNNDYMQVYFDTNKTIAELGAEKGFSAPAQHIVVHNQA